MNAATEVANQQRTFLREYYGKTLQKTEDLTEQACCVESTFRRHADTIALIPDEVVSRHYGCGCPIPEDDLEGMVCLDLGSGAGVDAFLLARLVGPKGHVHGIDMTDEQLDVARRNAPAVAKAFGYDEPNTTFHKGFIESAESIESASVDLVISDCVINLSPRKDLVFQAIHRVLKEGGELYISDIVADRRIPEEIANDPRLHAECLGGALYEHDLYDLLKDTGFADPRVVERRVLQTDVIGHPISFSSITVRAQKFATPLDRRCEDYGQTATYTGAFPRSPARYVFDDHHVFERDRPTAVCQNTARMLSETRLGRGFRVTEPVKHFGLFPCGPAPASASEASSGVDCC